MNLARYFVMPIGDRWYVTLEGRSMSSYPTRKQAIASAVVMADLMGAMHHDADVMVDTGSGLPLELVWSYGADAGRSGTASPAETAGQRADHGLEDQNGEAA